MGVRMFSVLTVLFAAETFAGPPFKTDDPEPVDYLHWEFYIASQQQFKRLETNVTSPHFELNYGVLPEVQLHLLAPLGYVHTVDGTHYGYSDTELGVKYRFVEETEKAPQIGVFPLIELPTGNQNEQLGTGKAQVYVPLWVQKAGENSRRMQGAAFGITPVLDKKTGLLKDGNFNTIFRRLSRLAVNSTTNQPTARIPHRAADSILEDSSISTTMTTYFFLLGEVCPERRRLPGTLAFNSPFKNSISHETNKAGAPNASLF